MSKVAKVLASSALATATLLPSLPPAQAGEWRIMGVEGLNGTHPPGYVGHPDVIQGTVKLEKQGQPTVPWALGNINGDSEPGVSWSFATGSVENGQLSGISAAYEIDGQVRVILQWQRNQIQQGEEEVWVDDPNDNPTPTVTLRVHAYAGASAVSDNEASHRDPDKEHVSASVTGGIAADIFNPNGKSRKAEATRLITVASGGAESVNGPWCALKARGSIDGGRAKLVEGSGGAYEEPLDGYVDAGANYEAAIDNRRVSISSDLETKYRFPQPYSNRNTPDHKTYFGFLKRHYTMTATEEALASFIGGVGRFELSAKKADGTDIFDNQQYAWSATGSHQSIYVDPAASGDTWKEQDIAPSHPRKHLHLNFGDDWINVSATNGYTTSVIRSVATGDNSDLSSVEGTATVHWFSPKLLELAGTEIPDVDPADQAIEDYMIARRQAIEQGAKMTATAFSFYGLAAEAIMPDPTMGVLKGLKFCGMSLRAARNAGRMGEILGKLKSQLVKQVDYSTVQGARVLDDVPEAASIATRMQGRNVKALDASSYVGNTPTQQNLDDLAQLVDGDTVSKQRIENLFADADQSRRRPGEVAQALSIEKKKGITLRRVNDADKVAGRDGDFIDVTTGKTYDPVGRYDDDGYNNGFFNIETSFKPAFHKHVNDKAGVDVVVVDTTGLTQAQAEEVINYANSYPLPPGKELEFLPLPSVP